MALLEITKWNGPLKLALTPHLFHAIPTRSRNSRTVSDTLTGRRWMREIKCALTVPLLAQYLQLWDRLQNVQLNDEVRDRFVLKWSNSGEHSASCTYLTGQDPLEDTRPGKMQFFLLVGNLLTLLDVGAPVVPCPAQPRELCPLLPGAWWIDWPPLASMCVQQRVLVQSVTNRSQGTRHSYGSGYISLKVIDTETIT